MLPIIPARRAIGHTITARIKNTGSSPPAQKFSPKSNIKSAYTRLWSTEPTTMPIAEAPVRIKNALEIFVYLPFIAKITIAIPSKGNANAEVKKKALLNRSSEFIKKIFNKTEIEKATVIQKITKVEI